MVVPIRYIAEMLKFPMKEGRKEKKQGEMEGKRWERNQGREGEGKERMRERKKDRIGWYMEKEEQSV